MSLLRFVLTCYAIYVAVRWLRRVLQQPSPPPRSSVGPRPPAAQEPSPYDVLGVSPGASSREVRDAYQQLVRQYHPDQVAHLGPELREVAERRTKEINAAYNLLKRN